MSKSLRECCPQLKLLVDHFAKPPIAERKMEPWARDMERLGKLPNIWCKISGLITEANWKNWTPEDLKPYVGYVVHYFGYDRLMFGSDWPVCTLAGSYQQVADALRQVLGPLSRENAVKVWRDNAWHFYHLS